MRITIVQGAFLPVPPLLGGAVEKVWFALGKEFARQGHVVTHVSRAFKGLPAQETIEGVNHRRISGFTSPATTAQRLLLDFKYALRARSQLPPADILITNSFWLPALEFRRSRGLRYVHVARYPKGQLKLYRRAILQTVTRAIQDAILAEIPRAAGRVRVIPYPLSEHYLRPELGEPTHTLLYTGRVHPEKGVHLLVKAFAHLSPADRAGWKLQIVGPAETACGGGGEAYLGELHAAAVSISGSVEFTGRIFDEKQLIEHYNSANIFIYPSLAERGETFGLAVLETMAAGCAPLVSNLACFRDFIRPEVNGQIFDHRSGDPVGALTAALAAMMRDRESTNRIRHSAWLTARDYTLPKIASLFLNDFAQLSGQNPSLRQTPHP